MISTDLKYLGHEFTSRRSLYAMIAGWNVATVRSAIDAHDLGYTFLLTAGLWVVASRWPWIFGPFRQRKAPPLGLSREVYGGDRGPARRAREGFARIMAGIEPRFGDVFGSHAAMGFAVLQHTWSAGTNASTLEPTTRLWPTACVRQHPMTGQLEAITDEGYIAIVDDGHWSVIGTDERPQLNGAVRSIGETWASAKYAERDEAALSAYLGRLCPIGILPSAIVAGSPEGDAFQESVRDLGEAQSGGIFPNGSEITTLPNVDAGAAALFAGFLQRRASGCAIALLGSDGTVSKGSPGVYTSPLFADVAFAIVREDTAHAAAALTRFGQTYGAINYGLSPEEAPGYRWLLPDPTEAARVAADGANALQLAAIVKAQRDAGLVPTQADVNAQAKRLGTATIQLAKETAPPAIPPADPPPP